MTNFTIGCDPEIFVKDSKTQKFVSAHGLIEGDKEKPHKIPDGAYQVDGMAVEFNTDPLHLIAGGGTTFSAKVLNVMRRLDSAVKKNNPDLVQAIQATADFDPEYLESQPEKAKELGCDPDFNAYTMKENPRPESDKVYFRTGAGHVHIGWTADAPTDNPDHRAICAELVKILDASVGLASVYYEEDNRRRELYGKAGAFRPKPYGVEYRTPSNFWIKSHAHRRAMYDTCSWAVRTLTRFGGDADKAIISCLGVSSANIRNIIDNGDRDSAIKLMFRSTVGLWNEESHRVLEKKGY